MGKLLRVEMVSEWRENAITRGGAEKYYFVICFSVDTSTPELASMESTCFASVTGVAFAECKRTPPPPPPFTPVLYNFVKIVHVKCCREDCLHRRPRIYLVSQTMRIVTMPLCCFLGSPRDDAPINVTEDYVSFRRNGKKKRRRRRWNELCAAKLTFL